MAYGVTKGPAPTNKGSILTTQKSCKRPGPVLTEVPTGKSVFLIPQAPLHGSPSQESPSQYIALEVIHLMHEH